MNEGDRELAAVRLTEGDTEAAQSVDRGTLARWVDTYGLISFNRGGAEVEGHELTIDGQRYEIGQLNAVDEFIRTFRAYQQIEEVEEQPVLPRDNGGGRRRRNFGTADNTVSVGDLIDFGEVVVARTYSVHYQFNNQDMRLENISGKSVEQWRRTFFDDVHTNELDDRQTVNLQIGDEADVAIIKDGQEQHFLDHLILIREQQQTEARRAPMGTRRDNAGRGGRRRREAPLRVERPPVADGGNPVQLEIHRFYELYSSHGALQKRNGVNMTENEFGEKVRAMIGNGIDLFSAASALAQGNIRDQARLNFEEGNVDRGQAADVHGQQMLNTHGRQMHAPGNAYTVAEATHKLSGKQRGIKWGGAVLVGLLVGFGLAVLIGPFAAIPAVGLAITWAAASHKIMKDRNLAEVRERIPTARSVEDNRWSNHQTVFGEASGGYQQRVHNNLQRRAGLEADEEAQQGEVVLDENAPLLPNRRGPNDGQNPDGDVHIANHLGGHH